MHTLHKGDALEWMKSLPAASVDCVFVDLPYFGVVADDWDNQWKDRNEYLDWVVSLAHEWKRITKSNSSIFVFCDEKMEAYIQVRLDEIFLLLNKIVWYRKTNEMKKFAHNFRTFAPATERALFYTTQQDVTGLEAVKLDTANFSTLRQYFKEFQAALGMSKKQIIERIGQRADHAFRFESTQWDLPTQETYQDLIALNPNHGFIPKEYEALRQEYEALRQEYEALRQEYEALRRPFNADHKTFDVLEFPAYDGRADIEHSTVKSLPLCRRILSVITDPGQVVLDCCMGSGTAGVAAVELGRHFLGCDNNPKYFAIAEKHIERAAQSPSFYTLPNNRLQPTAFGVGTQAQFPLLGGTQAEESSATFGGG
jgi:adenine-specific DNA-methyltransferase